MKLFLFTDMTVNTNMFSIRFTYSYKVVPSVDGAWGSFVNGSWNGMVGMVSRKVSD